MLSDYEDMIFKQLYSQLSNSDSALHLLLEEIRKEDNRTPSYLRNVKELEDKSLLHMVVYGDEHEEFFNEGLTDYRWLVEEVTVSRLVLNFHSHSLLGACPQQGSLFGCKVT